MNARERFELTRRRIARLNEVKLLIMYGCDDWRPQHIRAKTDKPDPTANEAMHRVDVLSEQLDELKREEQELESFIVVTLTIIAQVRAGFGEIYANLLEWHYIDGESWTAISKDRNLNRTYCYQLVDIAFDWIDSIGISRLLRGENEL